MSGAPLSALFTSTSNPAFSSTLTIRSTVSAVITPAGGLASESSAAALFVVESSAGALLAPLSSAQARLIPAENAAAGTSKPIFMPDMIELHPKGLEKAARKPPPILGLLEIEPRE